MKSTITHKLTIEEAKELILFALSRKGVIARETVSSCEFVEGFGDHMAPGEDAHFSVSVEADLVATTGKRKSRKTTLVEKAADATGEESEETVASDQSALDL